MAYKLKIDSAEGEIELEIEITHHEPFVPATHIEPSYGGDIDYDIIDSIPKRAFIPNDREHKLILVFLHRKLDEEKEQAIEDFQLRSV